jgi:hypothetical protein
MLSFIALSLKSTPLDNLSVQWGTQDHYEIVRKVGRGKYSEVRHCPSISLPSTITKLDCPLTRKGFRIHPPAILVKMYRQGSEAGQEEEDQEGDQDSAELGWRAECDRSAGCREGSPSECKSSLKDLESCPAFPMANVEAHPGYASHSVEQDSLDRFRIRQRESRFGRLNG